MKFTICTTPNQKIHRVLDWNKTITAPKPYAVIRARSNKQLLGQVCIEIQNDIIALICWLVVNPRCRGQGIGTLLIDKAEQFIESRNIHKIVLNPQKENEDDLVPWYEELGYEKTKRDSDSGEWIMLKEI